MYVYRCVSAGPNKRRQEDKRVGLKYGVKQEKENKYVA
jgi:alpha-galactosidase/6-phospho-beta-glucosidase family protein